MNRTSEPCLAKSCLKKAVIVISKDESFFGYDADILEVIKASLTVSGVLWDCDRRNLSFKALLVWQGSPYQDIMMQNGL